MVILLSLVTCLFRVTQCLFHLVLLLQMEVLEEAVEIQSWSQLGFHRKGIVYLDEDGFWDPFFALTQRMLEGGFLRAPHRAIAVRAHDPDAAIDALLAWTPSTESRWPA